MPTHNVKRHIQAYETSIDVLIVITLDASYSFEQTMPHLDSHEKILTAMYSLSSMKND